MFELHRKNGQEKLNSSWKETSLKKTLWVISLAVTFKLNSNSIIESSPSRFIFTPEKTLDQTFDA